MPAPRAARLALRKSIVPDPSLYGDPSDDSDDALAAVTARSTIKTTTGTASKPRPTASTTAKAHPGHSQGSRKPSRASTDSIPDLHARDSHSHPLHPNERDDDPLTAREPAPKRKKLDRDNSRAYDDDDDRPNRSAPTTKPTRSDPPAKRARPLDHASTDERSQQSDPPMRTGATAPRAAMRHTMRPNKPPPQVVTDSLERSLDNHEHPNNLSNPPSSHGIPPRLPSAAATKRSASNPKLNPKGKAPRTLTRDENSDSREPPIASTSRVRLTPPRPAESATHVAITTHETPVQIKNIAFRQGAGTPGTAGKSARRNSSGSARRGSSIGGGFTATPHPEISDSELWRSTDPLLPIAARTRSIISWATQRDRTKLLEGRPLSRTEQVAKSVIDSFIEDVCNLSLDTTVPTRQNSRPNPATLPPHPQNVANSAKRLELEEEFKTIEREQTSRQTTATIYSNWTLESETRRQALLRSPLVLEPIDPVQLAASFDLAQAGPESLEEALAFGQRLLDAAAKQKQDNHATATQGRRKSNILPSGDEGANEALDLQIRDALEDTAHLRQLTHRLSGFNRVTSRYVSHRSAEVHQALTMHSLQGLESTTTTATNNNNEQTGTDRTVLEPTNRASGPGGVGLARIVGTTSSASGTSKTGGLDPIDLLRAISRADSTRR
ncbi:uncharacterized protein JCM15063_001258 [Sporobolomyces koalae]|uniref:uncharacterized protein n=1 Tax=Sporobolomyces koalae TaxID=500713 RepID=UPI003170236B